MRSTRICFFSFIFLMGIGYGQQANHATPKKRGTPVGISAKETATINLYNNVINSVVTIYTSSSSYSAKGPKENQGLGSGVIISGECHILTAAHVVDGSSKIMVKTYDGKLREATVLFSEKTADIALLKLTVEDSNLPHAKLGDSNNLAVGQNIYAIGSPYGLENSFSSGIISAFRNFNKIYDGSVGVEFIQTDAAINSGNSGGPIFNSNGEVIGIASSILTVSGGFQGIGMIVAINTAKDLLAFEDRPWIGIESILVTKEDLSTLFNINEEGGLLIQKVAQGSPADSAGLKGGSIPANIGGREILLGGDIILELGQQVACHLDCLRHASEDLKNESIVQVRYLRRGNKFVTNVDISEVRKNFLSLKN